MDKQATKDALRIQLRANRAAITPELWATEDEQRTAHVLAWCSTLSVGTIACYASRPGEPGTADLIDQLHQKGWRVLLPKLTRTPQWAYFTGWHDISPGWAAIPEPQGPALDAAALGQAHAVIVPALAIDRRGVRLGLGGGWYDRALLHRAASTPTIALVRSTEVFDALPREPHDLTIERWATAEGITDAVA